MKTIFEYLDYRAYLKDFYEERKSRQSFFSYRLFGSKVGIDASYLVKVLIKSRHIADSSIGRFAAYCGLKDREAEYFEALVHFVKATSHKASKMYFEKLLLLKDVKAHRLLDKQYAYYQKWYHSAIRSILEFHDFRGECKALGERLNPPISAREAKESIRLLSTLNLIYRDPDGRYRMTDAAVTSGPEWQSLAIHAFQEETIRLSHESLSRHPREVRDVSTVTMNINEGDFEELRERIKEFRGAVIRRVNEGTSPDRVYQLNIQFFPLTQLGGRSK
jgi:uncharacterized protein (TIGR02147 family)